MPSADIRKVMTKATLRQIWVVSAGTAALVSGTLALTMHPVIPLYWHVPAAIMTYLGFGTCIVMNILRACGRPIRLFYPLLACDTGLLFSAVTLASGMIWGRSAWGTAWVWEPRLTGMLLMTLIFASWRLSAAHIARHVTAERVLTATLILLAMPSLAFTHLATRLFGGIHPPAMPPDALATGDACHAFVLTSLCYATTALFWILLRVMRTTDAA